jgi:hypothetical protein
MHHFQARPVTGCHAVTFGVVRVPSIGRPYAISLFAECFATFTGLMALFVL